VRKKKITSPKLSSFLIISDDPLLTAQLSSVLARRGHYTPVVDAPRMARSDADNEVKRRNNIAARYHTKSIILAGVTENVKQSFKRYFPDEIVDYVQSIEDLKITKVAPTSWPGSKFVWGKNNIGIGLLQALRKKQEIIFVDDVREPIVVNPELEHIIVCDEGNELAQVIAANYAFSIGAGMCLIPEVPPEEAEAMCESFYSSDEPGQKTQADRLQDLKNKLRDMSSNIPLDGKKLITFITSEIPWGFAYPEVPTAHIFRYPDLGLLIINAFVREQPDAHGLTLGLLIDPEQVQASEIEPVKKSLGQKGVLLKTLQGQDANVYNVSRCINLLPYDFLLISTHCGDATGWQWTYKYVDSEGIERTLVIHIAIGVGNIPHEKEMLEVMQYIKFISLDGVDWSDRKAKESLYVGTAMTDFSERFKDFDNFKPVKTEIIERVSGSSALKMWDNNFILGLHQIAWDSLPIVLNNACCSWHRLASTFTFANARAYIGTLFPVMDSQAYEIATRLTDKYFGKPLAVALWRAQNDVYEDNIKRPYIFVGPHFQRLHVTKSDKAEVVCKKLKASYSYCEQSIKAAKSEYEAKKTKEDLTYLKNELRSVYEQITNRSRR